MWGEGNFYSKEFNNLIFNPMVSSSITEASKSESKTITVSSSTSINRLFDSLESVRLQKGYE